MPFPLFSPEEEDNREKKIRNIWDSIADKSGLSLLSPFNPSPPPPPLNNNNNSGNWSSPIPPLSTSSPRSQASSFFDEIGKVGKSVISSISSPTISDIHSGLFPQRSVQGSVDGGRNNNNNNNNFVVSAGPSVSLGFARSQVFQELAPRRERKQEDEYERLLSRTLGDKMKNSNSYSNSNSSAGRGRGGDDSEDSSMALMQANFQHTPMPYSSDAGEVNGRRFRPRETSFNNNNNSALEKSGAKTSGPDYIIRSSVLNHHQQQQQQQGNNNNDDDYEGNNDDHNPQHPPDFRRKLKHAFSFNGDQMRAELEKMQAAEIDYGGWARKERAIWQEKERAALAALLQLKIEMEIERAEEEEQEEEQEAAAAILKLDGSNTRTSKKSDQDHLQQQQGPSVRERILEEVAHLRPPSPDSLPTYQEIEEKMQELFPAQYRLKQMQSHDAASRGMQAWDDITVAQRERIRMLLAAEPAPIATTTVQGVSRTSREKRLTNRYLDDYEYSLLANDATLGLAEGVVLTRIADDASTSDEGSDNNNNNNNNKKGDGSSSSHTPHSHSHHHRHHHRRPGETKQQFEEREKLRRAAKKERRKQQKREEKAREAATRPLWVWESPVLLQDGPGWQVPDDVKTRVRNIVAKKEKKEAEERRRRAEVMMKLKASEHLANVDDMVMQADGTYGVSRPQ